MTVTILRRRKLGLTSCREMSRLMQTPSFVLRNDRMNERSLNDTDLLVRWGTTASLPTNTPVLNTARAIHQVNDKLGFRRTLEEAELCPPTYFEGAVAAADYPLVVRPGKHAQGRNLFVVHNHDELRAIINRPIMRRLGWYASELINKTAEYRVFVVQGRAVAVAQKTPGNPDDVAWNVARGGRFDNVRWDEWPLRVVRVAIEAFNLSELDFGGVDVMVDGEGNAYVIEINSAPSLTSPYRQECMAKAFDYVATNGKERIPLIQERGGYRKFIHPAVCDRAQVEV